MTSGKYMRKYFVGLGAEGIVLETHTIEAHNLEEARRIAHSFLHPDKGYNYLVVSPLKTIRAGKEDK